MAPFCIIMYSGTADSGLSQIRINLSTKVMTYNLSIFPTIHFEPHKGESLSTKNKATEFMLSPKIPLF